MKLRKLLIFPPLHVHTMKSPNQLPVLGDAHGSFQIPKIWKKSLLKKISFHFLCISISSPQQKHWNTEIRRDVDGWMWMHFYRSSIIFRAEEGPKKSHFDRKMPKRDDFSAEMTHFSPWAIMKVPFFDVKSSQRKKEHFFRGKITLVTCSQNVYSGSRLCHLCHLFHS